MSDPSLYGSVFECFRGVSEVGGDLNCQLQQESDPLLDQKCMPLVSRHTSPEQRNPKKQVVNAAHNITLSLSTPRCSLSSIEPLG